MDLNGPSEDALEWDETDISNKLISIHEVLSDPDQELKDDLNEKPASEECGDNDVNEDESISNHGIPLYCPNIIPLQILTSIRSIVFIILNYQKKNICLF